MEKDKQEIEVRSEKVRNIVGKIPPVLLRIGISVISVVIILILVALYNIPYHEVKTLQVNIVINADQYYAVGDLDVVNARLVEKGQKARINIESLQKDYVVMGIVDSVYEFNGSGRVNILLNNMTDDERSALNAKPLGKASIYVSEKPILRRMLKN